jgi:activator of 2-hydroxyglutaryl-CoA dehydratase
VRPYLQNNQSEKLEAEHLLFKYKAVSSNLSTSKKKRKKESILLTLRKSKQSTKQKKESAAYLCSDSGSQTVME